LGVKLARDSHCWIPHAVWEQQLWHLVVLSFLTLHAQLFWLQCDRSIRSTMGTMLCSKQIHERNGNKGILDKEYSHQNGWQKKLPSEENKYCKNSKFA